MEIFLLTFTNQLHNLKKHTRVHTKRPKWSDFNPGFCIRKRVGIFLLWTPLNTIPQNVWQHITERNNEHIKQQHIKQHNGTLPRVTKRNATQNNMIQHNSWPTREGRISRRLCFECCLNWDLCKEEKNNSNENKCHVYNTTQYHPMPPNATSRNAIQTAQYNALHWRP